MGQPKLSEVKTADELDAVLDAGAPPMARTRSCAICNLGEYALSIVARAIERNDEHGLGNVGRISAKAVVRVLFRECGYRGSVSPLTQHAVECLGRRSWARK